MDRKTRAQLSEWMRRLADGDRTAFDPLFDAAWPVLRSYCARVLQDDVLGEDVAQQALLNVFARASEYDVERDALPWLLGVATWECRTHRRRRERRREEFLDVELGTTRSPEDDVLEADLCRAVHAAIRELSPIDAETLTTSLHAELGAQQAPFGATFRKRLQRAVSRLRETWRTRHGTP